jgi:hypothetical protein
MKNEDKAIQSILTGTPFEKRVMVGYEGDKKKKNGNIEGHLTKLMSGIRMPWFCPECDKIMKKQVDDKMWNIYGHCFDCQIDIEHKMRVDGTFEKWERQKILKNKRSIIKDQIESIKEWKGQGDASFVEPVNIDTGFVHIETYKRDPAIDKIADEALIDLDKASIEINALIKELND